MEKRNSGRISPSLFIECDLKVNGDRILIGPCKELATALGYEERELLGRPLADIMQGEDKCEILALLKEQAETSKEIEYLISLKGKSGEEMGFFLCGRIDEADENGANLFCVFLKANNTNTFFRRMNEQLRSYQERLRKSESMVNHLQETNEKDSLTQILNAGTTRRLCEEYLANEDKSCVIMVIDVDNFKRINDRYGHMVGDEVMICAAATIKKLFRANDIVGRIGGDEFLVLMKDVSDVETIKNRCSRVVSAFNDMKFDSMKEEVMSCSVGAALFPLNGCTYNALFLLADKSMYRSKYLGGNTYTIAECGK